MASRLTTFIVVLIVTGTVIAGLIVGAQRDDASGPVDLIITNGRVFTGAGEQFAEALAVQGNKILRVGSNREIKRLRRAQTLMLDAHGASVLPGLIDTHVHLGEASRALAGVDLTAAGTPAAVSARVSAFAEAHRDAAWIRGHGWPADTLDGALESRRVLDEAVPERAAYILTDEGTAVANSRALALAGITRGTPSPRGGVIVRDAQTGEPTGVLKGAAQELVARLLPEPTNAERLDGLQTAVRQAHSVGVTGVHSLGDTDADLERFDLLRSTDDLRLRVYAAAAITPSDWEKRSGRLAALREKYPDDPVLKTGAVLVVLDRDSPEAGADHADAPEFARLLAFLDAGGWQMLIQAPDENSLGATLDALDLAQRTTPAPPSGRRHRIEHPEGVEPETAARIAGLGLTISMPGGEGEVDPAACHLLADAGGRVTFGSDWPASALDPRHTLAALQAKTQDGDAAPEPPAERSLTLEEAVEAYTSAAAWSSFDDQRKGTLQRGMLADIVILTSDIFVPGRRLADVEVDTTIFDGKVVYTRTSEAGTR